MRRKTVKRSVSMILIMIALLCLLPLSVSANSAPPIPWYLFDFTNLPEGTKYVDLLIRLPEDDIHYIPLVSENLPEGFSEDAPIVTYRQENFCSYTFHYAGAKSMIEINAENTVYFFTDTLEEYSDEEYRSAEEHQQDIYDRGKIRLAMLDESGNILKVSQTFSIKPQFIFDYLYNTFHYDGNKDTLIRDTRLNSLGMLIFVILSILGVVLTCFLEGMIGLGFGLRKQYRKLVLCTNILSQVLMRILHILLYGWVFVHYVWTVVILEILVYTGEFIFYCRKMKDVTASRVFWFTVTANTVSLLVSVVPMMMI